MPSNSAIIEEMARTHNNETQALRTLRDTYAHAAWESEHGLLGWRWDNSFDGEPSDLELFWAHITQVSRAKLPAVCLAFARLAGDDGDGKFYSHVIERLKESEEKEDLICVFALCLASERWALAVQTACRLGYTDAHAVVRAFVQHDVAQAQRIAQGFSRIDLVISPPGLAMAGVAFLAARRPDLALAWGTHYRYFPKLQPVAETLCRKAIRSAS